MRELFRVTPNLTVSFVFPLAGYNVYVWDGGSVSFLQAASGSFNLTVLDPDGNKNFAIAKTLADATAYYTVSGTLTGWVFDLLSWGRSNLGRPGIPVTTTRFYQAFADLRSLVSGVYSELRVSTTSFPDIQNVVSQYTP